MFLKPQFLGEIPEKAVQKVEIPVDQNLKGGIPMRNLKRALSLALASVMLLGMMVVGTSAASYTDVSSKHNEEAIAVMQAVGVMVGDTNGKFNPDQKVTRGEMAVVMANLLNLKVNDFVNAKLPFTDVPQWALPYVAACYADGITAGISATEFGFNYEVTAAQAGLMMMKALGYFQFTPDFGSDWQLATIKQASYIKLYDGINAGATSALTRNEVAQLALNTLESSMVYYTGSQGTNITLPDGSSIITGYTIQYHPRDILSEGGNNYAGSATGADGLGYLQLCENLYGTDLKKDTALDSDDFGRPGYTWTYKSNKDVAFGSKDPVAVFTAETKANDVAKALSGYKLADASGKLYAINNTTTYTSSGSSTQFTANAVITVNSKSAPATPSLVVGNAAGNETTAGAIANETANGLRVEVYANDSNVITHAVVMKYTVAKVNNVTTAKDKTTYTFSNGVPSGIDYVDADTDDTIQINGTIAKGDYVTAVKGKNTLYVYPTTSVTGTQTSKNQDGSKITISGTEYSVGLGVDSIGTFNNSDKSAIYYIDQYGYVVDTTSTAASTDYVFVIGVNGKLDTTVDGSTPSVEARVLLADGTVAVRNVAVKKLSDSDVASGGAYHGNASNTDLNGTITFAAGDYAIEGTKICIYDASYVSGGNDANTTATVTTAANHLVNDVFGYTMSDSEIKLESLNALGASSNAADTVYFASMGNAVKDDTTSYANVKYDGSSTSDVTMLADKNTKFVVYNADKKTATVYTGSSNLPAAIDKENSNNGGTGYAVLKTNETSGTVGTASVIFVNTGKGLSADVTDNYIYIDATKYIETLVDGEKKFIYTGTKADGTTITLAPGDKIGTGIASDSGLFTYDKDNKVNTTKLSGGQYVNTESALTISGDLLGVGGKYYNITDDTKIVYIDDNLGEVNNNKGFVVLTVKDGNPTSDVEAIFVTAD